MESAEILGEPKEVHADAVRADLLKLGEGNDYATCRRVVEKVLGRRFHGALPLHPSYVPARCPADAMPQSGCYVKRKRWTDTLHLGYEPGVYLLVGENPNTSAPGAAPASVPPSEWCDTSDLAPSEWRNASGLQPAPYGFEKKNCAAKSYYAVRGVCFFRRGGRGPRELERGPALVQVLQISRRRRGSSPRPGGAPPSRAAAEPAPLARDESWRRGPPHRAPRPG
ncbi:hypothetical protein JL722_5482 [Aureococcus anophagefferens]|nr:hypothetical protein JL722_5482 [Aureococcus anophagefferens]